MQIDNGYNKWYEFFGRCFKEVIMWEFSNCVNNCFFVMRVSVVVRQCEDMRCFSF